MKSMCPHLQSFWILNNTQNHLVFTRARNYNYPWTESDYTKLGEREKGLTGPSTLTKTAKFREKLTTFDKSMAFFFFNLKLGRLDSAADEVRRSHRNCSEFWILFNLEEMATNCITITNQ